MTDFQEFQDHLNDMRALVDKYPDGSLKARTWDALNVAESHAEQLMTGNIEIPNVSLGRMS